MNACNYPHTQRTIYLPKISVVLHQEPGPVQLVLEAGLPVPQVAGLADVASVQQQARPVEVHLTPGAVAEETGRTTF